MRMMTGLLVFLRHLLGGLFVVVACWRALSRAGFFLLFLLRCPLTYFPAVGAKHGMDDHVLAVHLKRKPYGCSQCSYRSAQRSHLRRHQRDVGHTGDIMLPGKTEDFGSGAASSPAVQGFVGGGGGGMASASGGGTVATAAAGPGDAVGSALSIGAPASGAGGVFGGSGTGDSGVGGSSSQPVVSSATPSTYVPQQLGDPAGGTYYAPAEEQERRGDDDAGGRQGGEDVYSGSDGADGGGTETEEDMPPTGARRGGGPAGQ